MRRLVFVSGVVLCSLTLSPVLAGQSGPPLTPFRGLMDHVSATPLGWVPMGTSEAGPRAISGDGRYVVFASGATDLVPGSDSNGSWDVFLRDRTTGVTTRVSVPDGGGESNSYSLAPAISSNGRHVAFPATAWNLVAGDTNSAYDIFVRDLDANRTVRVSVGTDGTQGAGDSYFPSLSADGRFVAFISNASFSPGVPQYGSSQVFLHDRDSDEDGIFDEAGAATTTRVSLGIGGAPATGNSRRPLVSADGRYVMFESDATNLDPSGYSNNQHHLYVYDRVFEQTTMIDRAVTGAPSMFGVTWDSANMSDSGRFITYTSNSPDILPAAPGPMWAQVFRYDTQADPAEATTRISHLPDGTLGNNHAYYTTVSDDGRYVAWVTGATNLVTPAPPANRFATIVADTVEGTLTRVDVADGGLAFDGQTSFSPSFSADGSAIVLQSESTIPVNGAFAWNAVHIFVATAFSVSVPAVAPQEGGAGSIEVNTLPLSGWAASVPYSFDNWIVLTEGAEYAAGPRTLRYTLSPNPDGILRTGQILVGSTWVTIRQAGDGDTTPPQITPIVTGTLGGDGWYTSNVTVSWSVADPDSEIVNQSANCTNPVTIATDAIYAPVTCEATSHGGRNSVTFVVRRDTTPPSISITQPSATIYTSESRMPSYSCSEPSGYSDVATCEGTLPQNGWLDLSPGRHTFSVTATDRAGNSSTRSVEYIAGPGACATPSPLPGHLKDWWRFDGNLRDSILGVDAGWSVNAGIYQTWGGQQGWWGASPGNFLNGPPASATLADQGLTVAAWVRPNWDGQFGSYGTIVSNPLQYHIARYPDGTLRWAFNTTAGFDWVNTGVQLPQLLWSHVAVTYKDGRVRSYVNGRLVHDVALNGTLATSGNPAASTTIGGRSGVPSTYIGLLDDLMIFDDALSAQDLDGLALAGSASLCGLFSSALTLTVPPAIVYGSTFQASARLTDASGRGLPNRAVTLTSTISPSGVRNLTTDANGTVTTQYAITTSTTAGDYPNAITAVFSNDGTFAHAAASAGATVVGATPPLTWPAPAAIAYGTALGSAQLNATSTVPGTFAYSLAAGTVLDAGSYPVTVTFTPTDTGRWAVRTLTNTLVVNKATPTVEFPSAPLFYNAQPRQAAVVVRGVGGAELNPFTVLYNGAAALPVNAGTYALQVSYAGGANYQAVTATGSLVINKTTPIMGTFGDITETYDGLPHGVNPSVAGFEGWLTPVVVTYNGSTTSPVNAGVYAIEARYDGSANYNPVSHTATLTILKAAPYLTWPMPGSITYGTALGAVQLSATANVPGTFAYAPAAGTVLGAGAHTLTATFTPADAVNYETVTISRPLAVSKANAHVTWYTPAGIVYGTALGAAQLNATANTSGAFVYSPAAGTVLNAGTHVISVTFTPDDAANYNGGSASVPLVVSKAAPAMTWPAPAGIVYGTALSAAQLNATASVDGTFAYSPTAGTVLGAGAQTLNVTFTPADTTNYSGATTSVTLNVAKAASTIAWSNPAGIVYGTALGAAQLNATASVDGTFAYAPAAGTVVGAGAQTLNVTFTPADANYNGAAASVTLNVAKAVTAIAWPAPAGIIFGTGLGAAQLNATASVDGTFTYSPSAGTVLGIGSHTLTVTFTPSDTADYIPATETRSLDVSLAEPGVCVSSPLAAAHLLRWWKLDGNLRDSVTRRDATWAINPGTFQPAVAQLGWDNTYAGNALWDWDRPMATLAGQGLTVAAWVLPRGNASSQTLVSNTLQYRIDRDEDGTLRWAFKTDAGFDWVDTGVQLPASLWSHVAVTYSDGIVRSYVNGRLVHSAQIGPLTTTGEEPYGALTLGGHYDQATLNGRLDEVMIFDAALPSEDIESLAFSGSGSLCVPLAASTLAVTVPPTIGYASTFQVSAQLMAGERPVPNRLVTFTSPVAPGTVASGVTDATGSVTATLTVDPSAAMGDVPDGVVASFAGDDAFGAAEARAGTTVVPGIPPLELASHLSISYGTPVDQLFVAFSSVPGTFTFSPAAGTILDVGTYPLSVTLTPDDLVHWAPRTLTRPMVVNKAWPEIQFPSVPLVYTGQPQQANVTVRGAAGAELSPVTVLYDGATTLPVNAGTYALHVDYPGSANYNAVSLTYGSLVITKAAPTMPAFGDTTVTYDGQPHGLSINVTGVNNETLTPVVVTYNGSATVPVNAGVYTVEARYDGAANYTAVSRTATLTIRKAAPSITWATPAGITYGTPLGAAQLNATADVPGTFAYFPTAGTVLPAGSRLLSATFTPTDTSNYATATPSVWLNVAKATPSITWPTPADIVYGTALGAAQLNATSDVSGTFIYSPASGAVLNAGAFPLSVTFMPADSANYTGAAASRSLTVVRAPLTVRANDASKVFGAPLPPLSATVLGLVNGDSLASLTGSLVVSSPATAASPVGTYAITPSGVSSSNYAIGFVNGTLTVARASTTTSASASPNPSGLNQPVTLAAAVAVVAPGAGTPTGVVEFYDGSVLLGRAPLTAGTAALTTNGFTAGTHNLSASYLGDSSFTGSPASAALTVRTSGGSSTTAVTSSANPSNAGQNVTLTATVTAPSGLSGSVAFYDGATLIGTVALSGTTASLTTASLALGGHAITARYLGNATIPPSTSPAFAQYVRLSGANTRTSTVSLVASPSPAGLGSTVTLTATVTGSQNKAPTGVVLFLVNGFVLGQGTVTQTGSVTAVATLPTNALPHGTHRVEAVYLGDSTFRASKSLISLVVN